METKSSAIRALARHGLKPQEIMARGYNARTVYDTLARQRRRQGKWQMVEEILAINLEILKLVRGTDLPER